MSHKKRSNQSAVAAYGGSNFDANSGSNFGENQHPGSQGLNRYSYVANNPLTLTDPTGYSWFSDIFREVAAIAIDVFSAYLAVQPGGWYGLLIAAGGGFAGGVVATGTLQGGLIGAFSAAAFYGVGSYLSNQSWAIDTQNACLAPGSSLNAIGQTARAVGDGIAGGITSTLQGGKFGSGFVSAGVSAAAMPSVAGIHNGALQYTAMAMVGGTASVLAGGKFANGAETAVMQLAISEGISAARQNYGRMTPQASMLAAAAANSYACNDGGLMGIYGMDYQPSAGFSACLTMGWDGSLIMAYRGTEVTSLLDWGANVSQGANLDSSQYDQAVKYGIEAWKATGGNVIFTGHSLGGGLADAAAYATGGSAITFNAAGLSSRYAVGIPGSMTNYYIYGDALSTTQHFVPLFGAQGTQIMLAPSSPSENPLARHYIDNFTGQ